MKQNMSSNLWIYSDNDEQGKTASSLIVFGAEIFKRAKTINELNELKKIKSELSEKGIHPAYTNITEFIYEFVIIDFRRV